MNDLQRYFELQDRIKELEETVPLLEQIKKLKAQASKLEKDVATARKNASKHKRANDKLREKYGIKKPSRCDKATELIALRESGELEITLKSIAEKCFLSYSTVKSLARDYRKNPLCKTTAKT